MSLGTRNDLKNAVISWLYARTDVEANFDDFVTMTEEMLNHGAEDMQALRCRDMVKTANLLAVNGVAALPPDFLQLKYASDVTATPQRVMDYMTPDAASWAYPSQASGPGINFSIQGGSLLAQPNVSGGVFLLYYGAVPPLTVTEDINWLLTKHPSIYLRGCLLQAAEWLKDDNETMKQGVLFSKLVNGLNKSDMVGQYARADTMIAGLVV